MLPTQKAPQKSEGLFVGKDFHEFDTVKNHSTQSLSDLLCNQP